MFCSHAKATAAHSPKLLWNRGNIPCPRAVPSGPFQKGCALSGDVLHSFNISPYVKVAALAFLDHRISMRFQGTANSATTATCIIRPSRCLGLWAWVPGACPPLSGPQACHPTLKWRRSNASLPLIERMLRYFERGSPNVLSPELACEGSTLLACLMTTYCCSSLHFIVVVPCWLFVLGMAVTGMHVQISPHLEK